MILRGCVAFAKHVGPARLENELLPQCWEQVNNTIIFNVRTGHNYLIAITENIRLLNNGPQLIG